MDSGQTARTRYDPVAKMAVTEFSMPGSSSNPPKPWLWATRGGIRELSLERYRNSEGTDSLSEMVTRLILRNLRSLTPEHFANVPWVLAERLWRRIQTKFVFLPLPNDSRVDRKFSDLVSVGIWTAFVKAYHQDLLNHANPQRISSLLSYSNNARLPCTINNPSLQGRSLLSNLPHITAPNLEWITVLTLFDLPMSRHDWAKLCGLRNMGSLYVQNSGHPISGCLDDLVIRSWAEAARTEGAFPMLQLVMLVNQYQMTFGVLKDLSSFPRLRALQLSGPLLIAEKNAKSDMLAGTRWKSLEE
jgi:hypothetical protein